MNLGAKEERLWKEYKAALTEKFGITSFHTLLHLSDTMFHRVACAINISDEARRHFVEKRQRVRYDWCMKRMPGLTFPYIKSLATEIVDQMFEHWDFKAQLQ